MNDETVFVLSESDLDDLQFSPEYAEFLMDNADVSVSNGDSLLALQEQGYMFTEFLQSMGLNGDCA